eukprot:gene10446-19152_t
MPGHYSDIVEERSISKQCGYPLCSNALSKVPRQKFHISMERKQIYDITERKCYCSSQCYKNSKYVASQIPSSPLWLRKDKIEIEFLEDKLKVEDEPVEQEIFDADDTKLENMHLSSPVAVIKETATEEKQIRPGHEAHSKPGDETLDSSYTSHLETANIPSKSTSISTKSMKLEGVSKGGSTKLIDLPEEPVVKGKDIDTDKLCSLLQEWCTVDTYEYFKMIHSEVESQEETQTTQAEQRSSFERRKKSAKRFLQENEEWEQEVTSKDVGPVVSKKFVSPLIDSKSQQSIRRRIVSEKLKHSFTEVFSELCLSLADFKFDLTSLIKTFKVCLQEKSLKESIAAMSKELEVILKSCGIDQDKFVKLVNILNKSTNREKPHIHQDSGKDLPDLDYDNDSLD